VELKVKGGNRELTLRVVLDIFFYYGVGVPRHSNRNVASHC